MKAYAFAVWLVLGIVGATGGLESAAGTEPDYPSLIVTGLALFGFLQRAATWVIAHWRMIETVYRVLHRMKTQGDTRHRIVAGIIEQQINGEMIAGVLKKQRGKIIQKAQAKAAKTNGADPSIIKQLLPPKRRRVLDEVMRYVPIVGLFK